MKRLLVGCITLFISHTAAAADLVEVYRQALGSDPTYQQAISQRMYTKEGVPISLSALLPNIQTVFNPSVTRTGITGAYYDTGASVRNNTLRYYDLSLTLSQTVFNFTQFMTLASSIATSNSADATLNAALQSLMTRVAAAYLAVLQADDNRTFAEAKMLANKEQLDQAKQQYDVGIKTITDVYTARAAYDTAVAEFIQAKATAANNRENLRVITGKYYDHLEPLSENFPLISPQPQDVDKWVTTALQQNWAIKAGQYSVQSARQNVRAQFGGHLPTVSLQGSADRQYFENINHYPQALNQRTGVSTQSDRTIAVNMTFPIFSGGGVIAQTDQAVYSYEIAQQQLELTQRNTISSTRQSYLNILAYISQIKADRESIQSNISSLQGMEASYNVGTETLVNVLNQQEKLFLAQVNYATDRYNYVNSYLALKQAAGTLSFNDLRAINVWLRNDGQQVSRPIRSYPHKRTTEAKKIVKQVATHHQKAKATRAWVRAQKGSHHKAWAQTKKTIAKHTKKIVKA